MRYSLALSPLLSCMGVCDMGSPILFHPPPDRRQRAASREELAVAWLLLQLALIQQHASAQECHPGFAMHFPTLEQAVTRLTKMLGRPDGACRCGVENEQIGIGANPNGALSGIEPENACRVLRQLTPSRPLHADV